VNRSAAIEDAARRLAPIIRTSALIAASEEFSGEWCESITVPSVFFDGEISEVYKTRAVCIYPTSVKKSGELVRIDWHPSDISPGFVEISNLLRLELEPFIIGIGHILVDEFPEGGIIVRRDLGKNLNVDHPLSPA
jgi:hypothetical protein